MKKMMIMAVLLMSSTSFASSSLTGDWCQIYDDFYNHLKIESDGSVQYKDTVGSVEHHGKTRNGFVSIPGGGNEDIYMMLGGVKKTIINYSVKERLTIRLTTITILEIKFDDEWGVQEYKKCRFSSPIIDEQIGVEENV